MNSNTIRIGTRGSRLALIQTNQVKDALEAAHTGLHVEIVVMKASGDWNPKQGEVRLSEQQGGKGMFIKDIEQAILDGAIDIGVHSLKDVPTHMPQGTALAHFLERGDPRDVFISHKANSLDELPAGSVIGTASVRRQSVILHRRPDLKVVTFRGNIDTRLEKLKDGQVDAIILAAAGLQRAGLESVINSYLEPEAMLPAVGQGIVAIESREGDARVHALLDAINNTESSCQASAERALLAVLDGSCGTPIGSFANRTPEGRMRLRGLFAKPDGTEVYQADETAPVETVDDAYALGLRVGRSLRSMIPEKVLLAVAS